MRRTFVDILKNNNVDIKKEYSRLYSMFYKRKYVSQYSIRELINKNFENLWLRGTCISLDEFNEDFDFYFDEQPQNFTLDYLVSFVEYIYNLVVAYLPKCSIDRKGDLKLLQEQIMRVVEKIEHTNINQDTYIIFVPKKPESIYVAENVSESLSYKLLEYNHYSLRNNVEGKKAILIKIAEELECKRQELKKADSTLDKNLFLAFNNFNIRHNNCDKSDESNYTPQFARLNNEEIEELYDWTYNQSLIAFIKLENAGLNEKFKEIKNKIDNNIIE